MCGARCVALAFAVAACRPASGPSLGARVEGGACFIPAARAQADTVVIGIEGGVARGTFALHPRTPGDSLALVQVYETLLRVACDGTLAPGLADRWRGDSTGRTWTFFIGADAVFHDGTPVTANDVVAAWRERRSGTGAGSDARLLALEGVTVESERVLTVHLRDPHRGGPRLLADPYFSVHRRGADSTYLGTGAYGHPSAVDSPQSSGAQAVLLAPQRGWTTLPVLTLRDSRSGDGRDLIDEGVDVLLTAERSVIDYAATRPELRARPLPPDQAYVLLSTAREPGGRLPAADPAGPPSPAGFIPPEDPRWQSLRSALARDVLRQPWTDGADRWWISDAGSAGCAVDAPPPPDVPTHPHSARRTRTPLRLVYPAGDRAAAAIASRLVALATEPSPGSSPSQAVRELLPELVTRAEGPLVAVPVSGVELASSLRDRAELGYLLPVPRHALDPCAAWRALAARAPWIVPARTAFVASAGRTLITSSRAPAFVLEWNMMIRVVDATAAGSPP